MSQAAIGVGGQEQCRYKGVRRRRWGKWVSEIRVPGTRERLWLGSYSTPEAAAVAHDSDVYFLRGGMAAAGALNFPEHAAAAHGPRPERLSPRSVQRVASETGMAADAQLVEARESAPARAQVAAEAGNGIAQGGANARHGAGYDTYTYNCTYMGENSSISGNSGTSRSSWFAGSLMWMIGIS